MRRLSSTLMLVALLSACVPGAKSPSRAVPLLIPPAEPARVPAPSPAPAPPSPTLRTNLQAELGRLGRAFPGKVGIAVRDARAGWIASYNGSALMGQQSVSKLWVALAALDAVDRGALRLDQEVVVRRSDLTLFHQPIRPLVTGNGYRTTIEALLNLAMTRSDNTANDVLLWKAGGPPAVRRFLTEHRLDGVTFGSGERLLQSQIAGLTWLPEWAGGWGFLQARAKLTYEQRARALQRYVDDPYDGATANGLTQGLAALSRGELLSPESTTRLLGLMAASRTGPHRLRAGLSPGWTLSHKTGTGQELGAWATGYNDVGLLTGPDGQAYAVAVMIGSTRRPIPARQRLMADVVRTVIRLSGSNVVGPVKAVAGAGHGRNAGVSSR